MIGITRLLVLPVLSIFQWYQSLASCQPVYLFMNNKDLRYHLREKKKAMGDKEDDGQQFVKESKEFQSNIKETMVEMVQLLRGLNQQLGVGKTMQNGIESNSSYVMKPTTSTKFFKAKFLDQEAENEPKVPPKEEDDIFKLHNKYHALSAAIRRDMTFTEFHDMKTRRGHRRRRYEDRKGIQHHLGKITIPIFDGSGSSSARAWLQKLDTCFSLNPVYEGEVITFATLHLEGLAHEWWYHGMVTQGHNSIQTLEEFSQRLTERFDRKDPEIHF